MTTLQTRDKKPSLRESELPVVDRASLRELALKQIERKRRFLMRAVSCAVGTVALVAVWAITEYNNAGGWPTKGLSQSSSIPHVWNIWIIYPVLGIALLLALDAWRTFAYKPVSEDQIRREMDRLSGTPEGPAQLDPEAADGPASVRGHRLVARSAERSGRTPGASLTGGSR